MELQEQIKQAIERKRLLKWMNSWPSYRQVFTTEPPKLEVDVKKVKAQYEGFEREWRIKQAVKNANKS